MLHDKDVTMRTLSILLLGAVLSCVGLAGTASAAEPAPPSTATAPVAKPKPLPRGIVQIQLEDLHCKSCAKKLARKLYAVPGVMRVQSSLKKDLVTIKLQPKKTVAPRKLWDAVIAAEMAPVELRIADQQLTKKHFPGAKTAAKPPTHAKH